jgi:hypothetical protein
MASSQNRNTVHTPAARQPKFQCPQCIRRCYNRAGLKNHVRAMHHDTRSESQATSANDRASQKSGDQLSDSESYPQQSDNGEEHPMDVDFDVELPPAFSDAYHDDEHDGYNLNNDSDMPVDLLVHDHDSNGRSSESPPIIPSSPQPEHESTGRRRHEHRQTPANDRFLKRVYHSKLNGEYIMHFCHFNFSISYVLYPGQKCDQHGVNIAADSPPPPRESDKGPNDWVPYAGRVEFELADFIYRQNQMSASDIDTLLNLWNASAAASGESAPFRNHKHLYGTIDATPLGDIPWKSFSLQFNGNRPEGEVPSWMDADYDVWFRDPLQLVHNIISNPDFENGFDYVPYQEHDGDQSRCYHNFMSANWSWKQAVRNTNELVFYLAYS